MIFLKKLGKKIIVLFIPILYCVGIIFFDKQYLKGRWFEKNITGWRWMVRSILWQKIFGFNRHITWPVSPHIRISNSKNIIFHVDNIDNFQAFGNYFQNPNAKIYIGEGTYIGPNVGIITTNHNIYNLDEHQDGKDIFIGKSCWIGMNAMILPGVKLGDRTIVGAGCVVTKSFPQGNIVIVGNPARILRNL